MIRVPFTPNAPAMVRRRNRGLNETIFDQLSRVTHDGRRATDALNDWMRSRLRGMLREAANGGIPLLPVEPINIPNEVLERDVDRDEPRSIR